MLDFHRYSVLTFDCYGTLIDWEAGILQAARPWLAGYGVAPSDEAILNAFAELESQAEAGAYISYREVLRRVAQGFGAHFGFRPADYELNRFSSSLGQWKAFPDTADALQAFSRRYRLAVISNIDDELFAISAQQLPVEFDWVITAAQVRAYKPARQVFEYALGKMGIPSAQILHVAQSLYHDIVPASALGLATVWVNRRHGRSGTGATPAAQASADLEVPDLVALATAMGLDPAAEQGTAPRRRPIPVP